VDRAADQALVQSLRDRLTGLGHPLDVALRRMTTEGLAHDHFRLVGTALLVRVPVQSQLGLDPSAPGPGVVMPREEVGARPRTPSAGRERWSPPTGSRGGREISFEYSGGASVAA
jgi:hypothetical protein